MKRRILSVLLCVCFLLSGCNAGNGDAPEAEPTETAEEAKPSAETAPAPKETAETTSAPKETEKAAETAAKDEPLSFDTLSLRALDKILLDFPKKDGIADIKEYLYTDLHDNQLILLGNLGVSYRDSASVFFANRNYCFARKAEQGIAVTDEEKENLKKAVLSKPYRPFQELEKESAYPLIPNVRSALEFGEITQEPREVTWGKASVENLRCGYQIKESFEVNAFVSRAEEDGVRLIIDPAYMIGLPVYGRNSAHRTFDLNGTEVMMDSFPVTSSYSIDWDSFEEKGSDYFYARVWLSWLKVGYDFQKGYSCEAGVREIKPITYDLNEALMNAIFSWEEKDPEMAAVYTALLANADLLYNENTYGIVLLDLDFDGTPEVLRTRCADDDALRSYSDGSAEIDIYRIERETLRFIDRIECPIYALSSASRIEAVLARKTLSDGTEGWYGISGQNFQTKERDGEHCYFYRLDGDTLTATELAAFLTEPSADGEGEPTYRLFYDGKELELIKEKIPEPIPYGDENEDQIAYYDGYTCNGKTVPFSPIFFFHDFTQEFTEDISEVYLLFSDWIVPIETWSFERDGETRYYHSKLNLDQKKELSLRELSYQLAYLVDAYFLGEYSPSGAKYYYEYSTAFAKPVIYLYPEEKTDVSVRVQLPEGGRLTCTYPEYSEGWEVTALPDGTIYDKDGNEYYCLYWEGEGAASLEHGRGWCVAAADTAAFLREKLLGIGLTAREANEFIIYWLPELQKNPYNIISFHTGDYAESVPLTVSPAPDSVIRVFMTYEPTEDFAEIPPQNLPHYERKGFVLVEWGGSPSEKALPE